MSARPPVPRAALFEARLLLLAAIAFLMVFPFLWMASTSLKSFSAAFEYPPAIVPRQLHPENYTELFSPGGLPMARFFLNSVKITGLCVAGMLLSCSMGGFALSQLSFPGKRLVFAATLVTLMVPYQLTLIPVFMMFQEVGWKDTHYPLWLPAFFGGAFGVFLLRQFFLSVLATLGVFTFMASWNDLLNPLIYIDTIEKMPLTAGLSFLQGQHGSHWPRLMAAAMVSIAPVVAIYLLAQRAFVAGVATTGLKG